MTDLYNALLNDTKRHNPRPRAAKGLEWRWKHLKPVFGHVFATSVTTKRIDDYKDKRIEDGAAKATVNRELATLRRAFNFGRQQTPPLVFSVPPIRLFSEKGNEREGFVELADYDDLVAEATRAEVLEAEGPWLRALLECGFSYGWRKGELVGLRARQLNFTAREIRLPPVSTKSKKPRVVYMTDAVYELLRVLCHGKQPDDYVFTRKDGSPVKDFRSSWQNVCIRAGAPGPGGKPSRYECSKCGAPMEAGVKFCRVVTKDEDGMEQCGGERRYLGLLVHDLRRSAARALRRAGVSEHVIMDTAGWSTPSMFRRYDIGNERDQADAMTALERYRQQERETVSLRISPSTQISNAFEPTDGNAVVQ